jgi:hypothetical protein
MEVIIHINERSKINVTKSVIMISSKLIVIIIIMDVWIKALFNISGGSIFSIYKDILIMFLLFLFFGFTVTNPRNIIRNKIDYFVFYYILYAVFELMWTYYNTESFIIGIVRFRLYFLIYFLYFYFRYMSQSYLDYMPRLLKFTYKMIAFIFIWTILEFLLTSFGAITTKEISVFLERGSGVLSTSSYNLSGLGTFHRGFGITASILLNGILCVTGLAMLMITESSVKQNISRKLLLFAGFVAVFVSGAKTAWLLLLIILAMLVLFNRNRWLYFSIALFMCIVFFNVYINFESIRGSIDGTIIRTIPKYYFSLVKFIGDSSIFQILFGGGYSIHANALALYNIEISNKGSLSVGNEVFIIALFKQFGVIGMLFYFVGFIYMPLMVFKDKYSGNIVRGLCLGVLIAGISSIHYNAIFRSGVNILVVFSLAYISYDLDRRKGMYSGPHK